MNIEIGSVCRCNRGILGWVRELPQLGIDQPYTGVKIREDFETIFEEIDNGGFNYPIISTEKWQSIRPTLVCRTVDEFFKRFGHNYTRDNKVEGMELL